MHPCELDWWLEANQPVKTWGKKRQMSEDEVRHIYERAYGPVRS